MAVRLLRITLANYLLFAFASASTFPITPQLPLVSLPLDPTPPALDLHLTLRHIYHHGAHRYPNLHRKRDIAAGAPVWLSDDNLDQITPMPWLLAQAEPSPIQRLVDRSPKRIESLLAAARLSGQSVHLSADQWSVHTTPGPNVTDKKTILALAHISANAYVQEPYTGDWEDVNGGFNYTEDFGWQNDGLRGHIFADPKNSTVVIGLKGTTAAVFDGAGSTTKDKYNDNLLFGCCCGQGTNFFTHQVCDCQLDTYQCNSTCVRKALRKKSTYYYAGQDLYHNVSAMYPDAEIWLVGHSLGGAISSLLGMTFGRHVVTFEAPGDAMAAVRLGLPTPPDYHLGTVDDTAPHGAHHFGNNADPIFMGTCNGGASWCDIGGYAMESVCHTGKECVYDTMKDLGWDQSIFNHRIGTVIHSVIAAYNDTPSCHVVTNCTDCYLWKFKESNSSRTTSSLTTSTTAFSRTRTETCKTPGWWGCLDESTTSTTNSFTSSSTFLPTLPSWPSRPTSTSAETFTSCSSTSIETCETPGLFFGCWDTTTVLTTSTVTATFSIPTSLATSTPHLGSSYTSIYTSTCSMPGIFFGCWDPAIAARAMLSTPTTAPTQSNQVPMP